MTDTTQRKVDQDLAASIDLFRRADVGVVNSVRPCRGRRALIALDGSSQDAATVAMAQRVAEQWSCQFSVLNLGDATNHEQRAALQQLGASVLQEAKGDEPFERILAAIDEVDADFLIVPCPFGRDFESVGEDSTGTVVDVLISRLKIPFVAIRQPDARTRDPLAHVRIVLTGENEAAEKAAAYAVGLVRNGGRLELLLLVEHQFYENFRTIVQALHPAEEISYEDVERALAKAYARLHAGLQKSAKEMGVDYDLLVRHEDDDDQPVTPEHPQTHPVLMILALEQGEHDAQAEVHDYIRRSPHPVLVVPK
ncbi:MAG: hypothetical protein KatS3mg111_0429 [Pirellulaceae bacterium]|nr:MAG: hypothetical protein KatS3mg111_0429 [Pirellulaceae bacterium]